MVRAPRRPARCRRLRLCPTTSSPRSCSASQPSPSSEATVCRQMAAEHHHPFLPRRLSSSYHNPYHLLQPRARRHGSSCLRRRTGRRPWLCRGQGERPPPLSVPLRYEYDLVDSCDGLLAPAVWVATDRRASGSSTTTRAGGNLGGCRGVAAGPRFFRESLVRHAFFEPPPCPCWPLLDAALPYEENGEGMMLSDTLDGHRDQRVIGNAPHPNNSIIVVLLVQDNCKFFT